MLTVSHIHTVTHIYHDWFVLFVSRARGTHKKKMQKHMDQRICIKFCVKNEIKCSKTVEMLRVAYGEAALAKANVYKWYHFFLDGRDDVTDELRAGRARSSTADEQVQAVKKMLLENPQITIREVAATLGISVGSCQHIFANALGIRRGAAKIKEEPSDTRVSVNDI